MKINTTLNYTLPVNISIAAILICIVTLFTLVPDTLAANFNSSRSNKSNNIAPPPPDPTEARNVYITSHSHGYIKIEIVSMDLIGSPDGSTSGNTTVSCFLEVGFNGEQFLAEEIPSNIGIGFMFPVPAGTGMLEARVYGECIDGIDSSGTTDSAGNTGGLNSDEATPIELNIMENIITLIEIKSDRIDDPTDPRIVDIEMERIAELFPIGINEKGMPTNAVTRCYCVDSFFDVTYELGIDSSDSFFDVFTKLEISGKDAFVKTLSTKIGGNFAVDSFFDVFYKMGIKKGDSFFDVFTKLGISGVDSFFDVFYSVNKTANNSYVGHVTLIK